VVGWVTSSFVGVASEGGKAVALESPIRE